MRTPILLTIVLTLSFFLSELTSPSALKSVAFPLLFSACVLLLLIWVSKRVFRGQRFGSRVIHDIFSYENKK
jgi:hypothetical protein